MAGADDRVGSIPLFERLVFPLRKRIEAISESLTAEQGQMALTSAMPNGTATLVTVVHPPGHFVLASVLSELPYLMTVRAVMRSRVLAIEAASLRHMVEREPLLASTLMRSVSQEVRHMVRQVRDLKLRSATQRLGCYLLALVKDPEATTADFRLRFEKGLLAAQIGCRQENLSRSFAALREYGVETRGLRVILHDISRLGAVAMPDDPSDPETP